MNITFYDIINTFLYLGSLQGFILTYFLFNVKTNKISSRLLGILTSLWALILLIFALQSLGINSTYPHILNTFSQLLFAWFPLLYLSVKYFVTNHNNFDKKDLIHFIPLILSVLILIPFYLNSGEVKIELVQNPKGFYQIASLINDQMLSIQGVVYSVIILIILKNYEDRVVDFYANINHSIIKWMRIGVALILIAWIIGIVGTIIEQANIEVELDLFFLVYPFFVIVIYGISYVALKSGEVNKLKSQHIRELIAIDFYSKQAKTIDLDINKNKSSVKLENNDEEKFEDELNARLISFFNESKPYLNPDMSLQSLSQDLSVSRHQLSATINTKQKMNFFELINSYRVREVKELMKNDKEGKMKIYELAFEAGFNSKATFYRIFKQFSGITPTDYRKELLKETNFK